VCERENHTRNYTGSLLTRATSSSQKLSKISLCNQQQITNPHTNKEVILTSQEHSPSLINHTHKIKTPSDLKVQHFTYLQTWKQLQKKAGKITPDSKNYS